MTVGGPLGIFRGFGGMGVTVVDAVYVLSEYV